MTDMPKLKRVKKTAGWDDLKRMGRGRSTEHILPLLWTTKSPDRIMDVLGRLTRSGWTSEAGEFLEEIGNIILASRKKREKATVLESRITDCVLKYLPRFEEEKKYTKTSVPFLSAVFTPAKKMNDQLVLFPADHRRAIKDSIVKGFEGIELNVYEQRVLDGVLHRLSDEDYGDGTIEVKESELYDLSGIKKIQKGRGRLEYPGYECGKIRKALSDLSFNRHPIILKQFSRYDKKLKQNRYTVAHFFDSFFKVAWLYDDLVDDQIYELAEEMSQEARYQEGKLRRSFKCFRILPHPLLKADIERNFRLLPHDIYNEIKSWKQSGNPKKRTRVEASEILYVKWLHRHAINRTEIHIGYLKLAEDLKLGSFIKRQRYKILRKKITAYHKMGAGLGYLTSFEATKKLLFGKRPMDILHLNAERFYHLSRGKK